MQQLAYGALVVFLVGFFGPLYLLAIGVPAEISLVALAFCQACACIMGFASWRTPLGKACAFMALAVLVLVGIGYLLFHGTASEVAAG